MWIIPNNISISEIKTEKLKKCILIHFKAAIIKLLHVNINDIFL